LWRVSFDDDGHTRYYVSMRDGQILQRRNDSWRVFDFFWMLHTMDYRGRDDYNNPQAVLFAIGALWIVVSGLILAVNGLVPRSRRRA
jgi:hypothetical protein